MCAKREARISEARETSGGGAGASLSGKPFKVQACVQKFCSGLGGPEAVLI